MNGCAPSDDESGKRPGVVAAQSACRPREGYWDERDDGLFDRSRRRIGDFVLADDAGGEPRREPQQWRRRQRLQFRFQQYRRLEPYELVLEQQFLVRQFQLFERLRQLG
jgi:hypothetical protein